MPKLLLFVPCTKIITDQQDNSLSLVSIFEGLSVQISEGESIPTDAVMPFAWSVAIMWLQTSGDENRYFEMRLNSVRPDGHETEGNILPFSMTARTARFNLNLLNMRIDQPGEQLLRLSVREAGSDAWQIVSEYPI